MEEQKINNREQGNRKTQNTKEAGIKNYNSFWLVIVMLFLLFILVLLIIVLPTFKSGEEFVKYSEFSKWVLSVLLGAFGAWIGAGAAYFFGKENLELSSRSTEEAMRIQQKTLNSKQIFDRIKDMILTAMNSNFIFTVDDTKEKVLNKLKEFKGYWFVPIVDNSGVLQDIIHAQVFWEKELIKNNVLKEIINELSKDTELNKCHGDAFYIRADSNDKINEVYQKFEKSGAEVAIVVDAKGKPSHCLTKTELKTLINANR